MRGSFGTNKTKKGFFRRFFKTKKSAQSTTKGINTNAMTKFADLPTDEYNDAFNKVINIVSTTIGNIEHFNSKNENLPAYKEHLSTLKIYKDFFGNIINNVNMGHVNPAPRQHRERGFRSISGIKSHSYNKHGAVRETHFG